VTTYTIEVKGCFQPRQIVYTLEANACGAADPGTPGVDPPPPPSSTLSAWTDGTNWIDFDGSIVGWIEADGSLFPPADVLAALNA
jgi:hypothetical protein